MRREVLAQYFVGFDVWIGYWDVSVFDDVFEWVTPESALNLTFKLPPWDTDDPDRVGAGCVTFRNTNSGSPGLIGDKSCLNTFAWLCECDGYEDLHRR